MKETLVGCLPFPKSIVPSRQNIKIPLPRLQLQSFFCRAHDSTNTISFTTPKTKQSRPLYCNPQIPDLKIYSSPTPSAPSPPSSQPTGPHPPSLPTSPPSHPNTAPPPRPSNRMSATSPPATSKRPTTKPCRATCGRRATRAAPTRRSCSRMLFLR